jgi:hypothetical protein
MEEWKQIKEYPDYEISTMGNVRRIDDKKIMSVRDHTRYKYIHLRKNGERKCSYIHRLVALAFIANQDETKIEIDHINRDRFDNRVENLRWCSKSENNRNKKSRADKIHSNFRGVSWIKKGKWERWTASIRIKGESVHLGYFKKEEDARDAWIKYVEEHNLREFYE